MTFVTGIGAAGLGLLPLFLAIGRGQLGRGAQGLLWPLQAQHQLDQLFAAQPFQSACNLTCELQAKIGRARDQLFVFLAHPDAVEPTNNGAERLLRPAAIQRKMTNGYRAMWGAQGEAAIRTVVDTAQLSGGSPFGTILKTVGA